MSWAELAKCAGANTDLFFSRYPKKAKEFCSRCPVAEICLWSAVVEKQETGVAGGLTTAERREISKGVPRNEAYFRFVNEVSFFDKNNRTKL